MLLQAAVEAVLEGVAHGHQLDVVVGAHGVADGRPVPRPPQPIRPILIVSSPPAWALRADAQAAGQRAADHGRGRRLEEITARTDLATGAADFVRSSFNSP